MPLSEERSECLSLQVYSAGIIASALTSGSNVLALASGKPAKKQAAPTESAAAHKKLSAAAPAPGQANLSRFFSPAAAALPTLKKRVG
jgi:hypothetical protein